MLLSPRGSGRRELAYDTYAPLISLEVEDWSLSQTNSARSRGMPFESEKGEHRDEAPLNVDVVQFAAPIVYCCESDGWVEVDVIRLGKACEECWVKFATRDGSARAGRKYTAVTQEMHFACGELMQSVRVKLCQDDFFDPTLEFEVMLTSPECCVIGNSLKSCRVLIEDDDLFPDSSFREDIEEGIANEESVALDEDTSRLIFAFMRLTLLRVPSIWWKSLATIGIDQLHNAYYLMTVMLRVYLVDIVFDTSGKSEDKLIVRGSPKMTAMAVALLWVVPPMLLMGIDRLKETQLEMGKQIRSHFRSGLMRKYMNYSDASRHKVPVQDLATAIDTDIPDLIEGGFMFVFNFLKGAGKILVVSYFLLRTDIKFIVPLIIFPILLSAFLLHRQAQGIVLEDAVIRAEEDAVGLVVNAAENYDLINDYNQRNVMCAHYESMLKACFEATNQLAIFKFWNSRFVPGITLILVGAYLIVGSQEVLLGGCSLGEFLASFDVYKELGERFQGLYEDLAIGLQAGSPLVELTKLLNYQTDIRERREKAEQRKHLMQAAVQHHLREKRELLPLENVFDSMPIKVTGLELKHLKHFKEIELEVQMGQLIFITGGHDTGKSTLMKILADRSTSKGANVSRSAHIRVLHVSEMPVLLTHLNLLENLCFGVREIDAARVHTVFAKMGMGKNKALEQLLIQNITDAGHPPPEVEEEEEKREKSDDLDAWHQSLSHSEMRKLHFARSLVFNPQALVVQKPMDHVDSGAELYRIGSILRSFVDDRGIGFPNGLETRRPRTLFFSGGALESRSDKNMQMADVVWTLSDTGIESKAGGSSLTSEGWGLGSAAELAEINADLAASVGSFAMAGVAGTLSIGAVALDPLGLFSASDEGVDAEG